MGSIRSGFLASVFVYISHVIVARLKSHSIDLRQLSRTATVTEFKFQKFGFICAAGYPAEEMKAWKVSRAVGNTRNNDASLILPV